MGSEAVVEMLRDWIAVSNPGLATKDDLERLESRIDELTELVDAIEDRLAADAAEPG